MQAVSHKVFNGILASDLLICCYKQSSLLTSCIAGGLIVFSSFPDKIEQLGLKHRGISHSVIAYLGLACFYFWASGFLNQYFDWICYMGFGFVAGCLGHILADMFSKNGVKVLGAKFNFGLYSTGTISEQIFLFGFALVNYLLIYFFALAK